MRDLNFHYRGGTDVFRNVNVMLEPGRAYRLFGPNGVGKTTLLKILVGVLVPSAGQILLGGANYTPWRDGNTVFALATQNPDHQWCGATLQEDIARRRAGLKAHHLGCPTNERLAANAKKLGIATLEQHLYELPLAARKRLSWLWPLSGVMPWVMLDEPTIGQDGDTRQLLATALAWLCTLGYGVVFVTHDDDFARRVPHRGLSVTDKSIKTYSP
jgi:energy-coupling factor transport system ATP-binding protein